MQQVPSTVGIHPHRVEEDHAHEDNHRQSSPGHRLTPSLGRDGFLDHPQAANTGRQPSQHQHRHPQHDVGKVRRNRRRAQDYLHDGEYQREYQRVNRSTRGAGKDIVTITSPTVRRAAPSGTPGHTSDGRWRPHPATRQSDKVSQSPAGGTDARLSYPIFSHDFRELHPWRDHGLGCRKIEEEHHSLVRIGSTSRHQFLRRMGVAVAGHCNLEPTNSSARRRANATARSFELTGAPYKLGRYPKVRYVRASAPTVRRNAPSAAPGSGRGSGGRRRGVPLASLRRQWDRASASIRPRPPCCG